MSEPLVAGVTTCVPVAASAPDHAPLAVQFEPVLEDQVNVAVWPTRMLVGATEGLAGLATFARLPVGRRPRLVAAWLILAGSLPYSAYALATDRAGAQRSGNADFDAACAWILQSGSEPGPILTRHPGEVYWQTGRQALAPGSSDPEVVRSLEQIQARTFAGSREVSRAEWRQRSLAARVVENTARLADSLL